MSGIVLNYKYKIVIYILQSKRKNNSCPFLHAVYKYKTNEMHVYVIKLYLDIQLINIRFVVISRG